MDFEINYINSENRLSLSIAPGGMATLTIRTNRNDPGKHLVGLFRRKLEASDIAVLVASLCSNDFKNIKNPVSASPGEPIYQLSIKEQGGVEVMRWTSFHTPTPPAFLVAEEQAMALVKMVRQYPVQAMEMQLSDLPSQIEREKPMEFTITIVNPGSDTIQLLHPENWAKQSVRLRFIALRSDIPLEKLRSFHQKFEDLSAEQIKAFHGPKTSKPLVVLVPGERLILTFGLIPNWPPGQYDVNLSLSWPLFNKDGVEQMVCELVSKTFTVKVIGQLNPGDEPDNSEENTD